MQPVLSTQVLGAWSPTNTGSTVPAPTLNSVLLPATYFYEPATYLKLRNVTLGYELPDAGKPQTKHNRMGLAEGSGTHLNQ